MHRLKDILKWISAFLSGRKGAWTMAKVVDFNDAAFKRQLQENAKLMEENRRLGAEIATLVSDRLFVLGFNAGFEAALDPQPENAKQPL